MRKAIQREVIIVILSCVLLVIIAVVAPRLAVVVIVLMGMIAATPYLLSSSDFKFVLFLFGMFVLVAIPYAPGVETSRSASEPLFNLNATYRVCFVLFSALLYFSWRQKACFPPKKALLLFLTYILALILSGFPDFPVVAQFTSTLVVPLLAFIIFLLSYALTRSAKEALYVIGLIVVIAFIHEIIGVLQLLSPATYDDIFGAYFPAQQFDRLTSIWANGPVFASFMVFTSPFLLYACFHAKNGSFKLLSLLFYLLMVLVLFQAGSRAPAAVFLLVAVAYLIHEKKTTLKAFIYALMFGTLVYIVSAQSELFKQNILVERILSEASGGESSAMSRLLVYGIALTIWLNNFLFGIGFQQWFNSEYYMELAPVTNIKGLHSGLLQILVETGLVGGIAFLALAGYSVKKAASAVKDKTNPAVRNAVFTMVLGFLAILFCSIVDAPVGLSPFYYAFWMICGVTLRLSDDVNRAERSDQRSLPHLRFRNSR